MLSSSTDDSGWRWASLLPCRFCFQARRWACKTGLGRAFCKREPVGGRAVSLESNKQQKQKGRAQREKHKLVECVLRSTVVH